MKKKVLFFVEMDNIEFAKKRTAEALVKRLCGYYYQLSISVSINRMFFA